ncbi:MAG: DNA primase [Actinomycetota bacterium]|nr:DNA primase [Actinomycetota bacterium]
MAYSRDDIDSVREKTDLVELAAEITKVKRSGRSTMAVCPFHSEKTPSLSIDGARGLYHCFGCGKSGDIYRWVQETQGVDFAGAVELLARRAGVTLTVDPGAAKRRSNRERLVEVTAFAVEFFAERLTSAPDGGSARSYLRSRGYDGRDVADFSLGYSPDSWDELVKHLRDLGVRDDTMEKAGLVSPTKRGGIVDRFRGRVMFPIFDLRGDPVGFGARILDGDGPKYLNTPETAIYHKSRLLYGLNWAKSDIVRKDASVVVEGYTDVIAMHRAEMRNAVATCGTALGEDHLDLLRRFSERVVLAFDADEAGAGAALRGFDRSVPGDLDLRVAILPQGKDPADVVADGEIDSLRTAVASSIPLIQVRIDAELAKYNLDEPEARARAVKSAASVISLHPDVITRHEYAVGVARKTGVDVGLVEHAIGEAIRGNSARRRSDTPPPVSEADPVEHADSYKTELELLRVMLANDARLVDLDIGPALFYDAETLEVLPAVQELLDGLEPGETPDLGAAIGSEETPQAGLLRRLALDERPLADPAELVGRLEVVRLDEEIVQIRRTLQRMESDADNEGSSELLKRLVALEQDKRSRREIE